MLAFENLFISSTFDIFGRCLEVEETGTRIDRARANLSFTLTEAGPAMRMTSRGPILVAGDAILRRIESLEMDEGWSLRDSETRSEPRSPCKPMALRDLVRFHRRRKRQLGPIKKSCRQRLSLTLLKKMKAPLRTEVRMSGLPSPFISMVCSAPTVWFLG